MKCFLCDSNSPKYKCPNCKISYCSLKCWRTHRDEQCEKVEEETPKPESTLEFYSFPTEHTVPIETLKLLDHSSGVRDTLYNPHVRNILNLIDKSRNPTSALKDAMQEPIFVQFVEECLKVIEPAEGNLMDYN